MNENYDDLGVGAVLRKEFSDLGPECFDLFVRTNTGWVLIDQDGVHPHAKPHGAYTVLYPLKVSED